MSFAGLHNTYYALRHGRSVPNERGLIVSDPRTGCLPEHGLTLEGRAQVLESARSFRQFLPEAGDIVLAYSPFSRAKETAEIVAEVLGEAVTMIRCEDLRERFFGALEGKSTQNYDVIWGLDAKDASCEEYGAESVHDVLERVLRSVRMLESRYATKSIVLVGHGDVLQIAEAVFQGKLPGQHRFVKHLENAELRMLSVTTA